MSHPGRSERPSMERPLFVLRYRRYKVWIRTVLLFLCALITGLLGVAAAGTHPFGLKALLAAVLAFGLSLSAIPTILYWQSVVEIRLYKNRIVGVSKLLGEVEVMLADAQVKIARLPGIMFIVAIMYPDRYGWLGPGLTKVVSYDVDLADFEEARKLNCLLAQLSGRRVEEFERSGIIKALIEKKEER